MSEKEKNAFAEIVETAAELARYDPQSLILANSNMKILKARSDLDRREKELLEEEEME